MIVRAEISDETAIAPRKNARKKAEKSQTPRTVWHETLAYVRDHLRFSRLLRHAEKHHLRSNDDRDEQRHQNHDVKDAAAKSFLECSQGNGEKLTHSKFLPRTSYKGLPATRFDGQLQR